MATRDAAQVTIERLGEEWVVRVEAEGSTPQQFRCASEPMARQLLGRLARLYGTRPRSAS